MNVSLQVRSIQTGSIPQLAVLAMNDGVFERDRWSRPISGAPSDPLNEDPEPETQRYFVDTVCDLKR